MSHTNTCNRAFKATSVKLIKLKSFLFQFSWKNNKYIPNQYIYYIVAILLI